MPLSKEPDSCPDSSLGWSQSPQTPLVPNPCLMLLGNRALQPPGTLVLMFPCSRQGGISLRVGLLLAGEFGKAVYRGIKRLHV